MDELKWEDREQTNFTKMTDKIKQESSKYVLNEVGILKSKIEKLNKMGVVNKKDFKKIDELIKNLKV